MEGVDVGAISTHELGFGDCAKVALDSFGVGAKLGARIQTQQDQVGNVQEFEVTDLNFNHLGAIVPLKAQQGIDFFGAELQIESQTAQMSHVFVMSLLNACVGCNITTSDFSIQQGDSETSILPPGAISSFAATCGGAEWSRVISSDGLAGRMAGVVCFGVADSVKWFPRWIEVSDVEDDTTGNESTSPMLQVCNNVPVQEQLSITITSAGGTETVFSKPIAFSDCVIVPLSSFANNQNLTAQILSQTTGPIGMPVQFELLSSTLNHIGSITPTGNRQDTFFGAELQVGSLTPATSEFFGAFVVNSCIGCDMKFNGDVMNLGEPTAMLLPRGVETTWTATCEGLEWEETISSDMLSGRVAGLACIGVKGSEDFAPRWVDVTDFSDDTTGGSGGNDYQCLLVPHGAGYKVLLEQDGQSREVNEGEPGPCQHMFMSMGCGGTIPDLYHASLNGQSVYLTTTCGPQSLHLKHVQWRGSNEGGPPGGDPNDHTVFCESLQMRVPFGVPTERQVTMYAVPNSWQFGASITQRQCDMMQGHGTYYEGQ